MIIHISKYWLLKLDYLLRKVSQLALYILPTAEPLCRLKKKKNHIFIFFFMAMENAQWKKL